VHTWEANKENYYVRRQNPQDSDWNIANEKHIETNYVRLEAMKKW
jgi:hypothetical protein